MQRNSELYRVVQAKKEDMKLIKSMLRDTALWLKDKGVNQWQHLLTDEEDAEILSALEKGETYLVFYEASAIATFNLNQEASVWDRQIWKKNADEKAIYLHRLTVINEYKGKRIGQFIIHWIIHHMSQNSANELLRLDCVGHNDVLNDFYKKNGFTYKGMSGNGHSKYEQKATHSTEKFNI